MFVWFEWLGISPVVRFLRSNTNVFYTFLPEWVYLSLPNALWLFSGILFFDGIWGKQFLKDKLIWIVFFIAASMGLEITQAFHILPGTFDWHDIFLMTFSAIMAIFLLSLPKNKMRRKEYE
jgi:hypothetical protein